MIRHENENGSVNVSTSVYTDIVGTADFARCFPENFTVCTAVIVLCHSVSTCPHRLYKGVGFDFYNRSAPLAER